MKEHLEVFLQNPWSYIFGLMLLGLFYYFKRKLENLADKNDIADITREVEGVKSEFNIDLEKLKVNLDILKSNRISTINEKRNSIYQLWISIVNYNNNLDSFLNKKISKEKDLHDFFDLLDSSYYDYNKNLAIFELLLFSEFDNKLVNPINKLYDSFIDKDVIIKAKAIDYLELVSSKPPMDKFSSELNKIRREVEIRTVDFSNKYNDTKALLVNILEKLH